MERPEGFLTQPSGRLFQNEIAMRFLNLFAAVL